MPKLSLTKRRIAWIAVPLLLWGIAEVMLGRFFAKNLRWYEAAEVQLRDGGPVNAIFIGSSRVNAAIDPSAVEAEITKLTSRPARALNLGYGETNITEHYLGLRHLFETHPDKLKGAIVFIEAPEGLPEERTWDQPWVEGNLSATLPFLSASDLTGIWKSSATFENKTEVTLRLATRWSNVMARKDKVQQYAFMVNDTMVAPRLAPHSQAPATTGDLTTEGGIRADNEGIEEARRLAVKISGDSLSKPQPAIADWDRRVVSSLVHLIREQGGIPVFFEVPLSSVMSAPYRTTAMRNNESAFASKANEWSCPILKTDLATTDNDFPDLWHMRKSLASEYSRRLVEASQYLFVR